MAVTRVRTVGTMVVLAFGLAACGGDNNDSAEADNGGPATCESVTARASHHIGPESAGHQGLETLADEVAELTDGRVTIEIFPSGQLGGLSDNAEALRTGTMDLALVDSSSLSQFVGEVGALDLPFVFETQDQFNEVLAGEFGEYVNGRLQDEVDIVPLYWSSVGMRNILLAAGVDEVRTPDDLEGMTLRIPDAPVYKQTFELLGATTVVVDAGELYTSVQTGVVDGFEFPMGTARDFSMQEVVGSVSQTAHIHTNTLIAASSAFADSLCEEDREALLTASEVAKEVANDAWIADNEAAIAAFEDADVSMVEVDRDVFIDAVQPVYETFTSEQGEELFSRLQDAIGQ